MTESREWPTDEEIRGIAEDQHVPLSAEAYNIAHEYHRISEALSANQLGSEDLNWCGFAQWSSKAVGSELRLGNHSGFLRQLGRKFYVPMAAEPLFRRFTLTLLGGSYGAGLSIANRSIFVEMASLHTQFLSGAVTPQIMKVDQSDGLYPHLLQHLGTEGAGILEDSGHNVSLLEDLGEEGQELLCTAYNLLSEARSASGKSRSELILGANIALSAYEQKRVQPALEFVFYRPVRWAMQTSWRTPYFYVCRTMYERFHYYLRQHQDQPQVVQSVEDFWVKMYSKTLWLKTAITTVALGQPLALPPEYGPPQLRRAASTFESADVARLVQRYGPADPAQLNGVSNWLDYDERMRFIVAYFMTYQQIGPMFDEPRLKRPRSRRGRNLGNPQIRRVTMGSTTPPSVT
jgi:hypothetical protein